MMENKARNKVWLVRVADLDHDLADVCCRRKLPFVLEAAVQRLPTTAFKWTGRSSETRQ